MSSDDETQSQPNAKRPAQPAGSKFVKPPSKPKELAPTRLPRAPAPTSVHKQRPVGPMPTAVSDAAISDTSAQFIDDDDSVIVPAPLPAVFAPKPNLQRPPHGALSRSLGFRRTVIPILLTLGALLIILGSGWFALDADSTLRQLGNWPAIALLSAGPLLLLLGITNALVVRQQLAPASDLSVRALVDSAEKQI